LPAEERVVDEIVGDAVDVPGDAHGINESQDGEGPKRQPGKEDEQSEEVAEMETATDGRNGVPRRVCEDCLLHSQERSV